MSLSFLTFSRFGGASKVSLFPDAYQKKKAIGDFMREGMEGENAHSSMGGGRMNGGRAVLRVMCRGPQSNYGTTKDRPWIHIELGEGAGRGA